MFLENLTLALGIANAVQDHFLQNTMCSYCFHFSAQRIGT